MKQQTCGLGLNHYLVGRVEEFWGRSSDLSKFYARCLSLSSFNEFSKRSTAPHPWVLAQLASSFGPSSKARVMNFYHPAGTHDDQLWALALAVYAAKEKEPEPFLYVIPK